MDMPIADFLTALYTIVDDWYQQYAPTLLRGKPGQKPRVADSEVLTLALAQHWLGYPHEREWLRVVQHNYQSLFPRLLSQSEFNRRVRNLCWLLNMLRYHVVQQLGLLTTDYRLLDGTPIHVRHWRRYGPGRLLLPGASLGYCAAKKETFYGYRLVVLTTSEGIITDWTLVGANVDERDAAEELLDRYRNLHVLGDKGFLDQFRQTLLTALTGNHLLTPKRRNQAVQNPAEWDALLNRVRRKIETVFSQAKDVFGLEKPGARTLWGLLSRVIAKLTGLTLAAWVNKLHNRSPLALAHFTF
jgi:hypothetical protein